MVLSRSRAREGCGSYTKTVRVDTRCTFGRMRVLGIQLEPAATRSISVPTLSTPDVTLRPWRRADVPALVEAGADPYIANSTSIPHWDASTAEQWVDAQRFAARAGTGLRLAVCAPGGDEVIGGVQLKAPDWEERRTEAGYWLCDGARGRGVELTCPRWRKADSSDAEDVFADYAHPPQS